jgi:endonuclease YncB( thermonuclease family)
MKLALRKGCSWYLPRFILVALFAAFFNPPEPGVISFEFVQRVVDGDTLLLGTCERVRLIGVNTPETVHPQKGLLRRSVRKPRHSRSAWSKGKLVPARIRSGCKWPQRREGPLLADVGIRFPARRQRT